VDGAYYLAGYAVECALKACIAKLTAVHDFPPPRAFVQDCYTHDLGRLVRAAGLKTQFDADTRSDLALRDHWNITFDWDESSRYERKTPAEARALFDAISDVTHGVLPWVKRHW
jgi:hypothetical protein